MAFYNWQLLEKNCVQQRGTKNQKVKSYFLYKEKIDQDLYFYSSLPKNVNTTFKNVYLNIEGKTFIKKDFNSISEIKPKNKVYVYGEKILFVNKNNIVEDLPDLNLFLSARYLKNKKEHMLKLFNDLLFKHWKKDEFKKVQKAFDNKVFAKKINYFLLNNNVYTNKFNLLLNIYTKIFMKLSLKNQVALPLLKNIALNSFLDNEVSKTYNALFLCNPRQIIFDSSERNFINTVSLDLILKNILQKKSDFILDENQKRVLFNNLNFMSENKLWNLNFVNSILVKKKYSKNIFKNKKSFFQIKPVIFKKYSTKNILSHYVLNNSYNLELNKYSKEHRFILSFFLKHKISLLRLKNS
jgi:hypothetical protein